MKYFLFKQSNYFGDDLSITLAAHDKDVAEEMVRMYIMENTESPKEAYFKHFDYMKELISQRKREMGHLTEEEKELSLLEKNIFLSDKEVFSISDFDKNDDAYIKFAKKSQERTYLWFFDNEPYSLEELKSDKSAVLDVNFSYSGK